MNVGDYAYTKNRRNLGIGKIYAFCEHNNVIFSHKKGTSMESIGNIVSSLNIIDLIEVGDVIRYEIETPLETSGILKGVGDVTDEEMLQNLKKDKAFHVKSIVTREQFSQMEYKVGE